MSSSLGHRRREEGGGGHGAGGSESWLPLPMTAQIVGLLFCSSIYIFLPAFSPAPDEMTGICQETVRFVWFSFGGTHLTHLTHLPILLLPNPFRLNLFVCFGLNVKKCLRLPHPIGAGKLVQKRVQSK